jgi:hypothetical protein
MAAGGLCRRGLLLPGIPEGRVRSQRSTQGSLRHAPEPAEQWRVVTRDGVVVGWVELPGALAILDACEDRVLAVRLNEFEVPAVTMFGLRRR